MDFVKSLTKTQLIGLAILVILVVAIPLTLYLVRQQQILRSRAQEGLSLTLFQGGQQLQGDNPTVSDRNIEVRVVYTPPSVPSPSPSPSPATSPPPPPVGTPVLTAIADNFQSDRAFVIWSDLVASDNIDWFIMPVKVIESGTEAKLDLTRRLASSTCVESTDPYRATVGQSGTCYITGLEPGAYIFALIYDSDSNARAVSNQITR